MLLSILLNYFCRLQIATQKVHSLRKVWLCLAIGFDIGLVFILWFPAFRSISRHISAVRSCLRKICLQSIYLFQFLREAGCEKNKIYDITAHLLLVFLTFMMLTVVSRYLTRKIMVEHLRLQGRTVSRIFLLACATPEDFSLIYLTYPVDLSLDIPLDLSKRGDFDIFYQHFSLATIDYCGLNPYGAYLYGNQALSRITNHKLTDGKRILMLGNSYDNCVIPFWHWVFNMWIP